MKMPFFVHTHVPSLTLFGAAFCLLSGGCSSNGNGETSSSNPDTTQGAVPVPAPKGALAATSLTRRVFAMKTFDTGVDSPAAPGTRWQSIGFNLDGKTSTGSSKDVCANPLSSKAVADGKSGIDNGFSNIATQIGSFMNSSMNDLVGKSLKEGAFTVLFDITGLSDQITQTNQGLGIQIFSASSLGSTPTWSKNDKWKVNESQLQDKLDPNKSKIVMTDAYVNDGWVVGRTDTFPFQIVFGDTSLSLLIHGATISFKHSSAGELTLGTLSGVLDLNEFTSSVKEVATRISPQLCGSESLITGGLRGAADIMTNGSSGTSDRTCTGISVGVKLEAVEVAIPTETNTPPKTPSDPCSSN